MGYDRSVSCLADDPRILETRSNTLRTPEFYRKQTITYISNKQQCTSKTQIREVDQKVQLKNSGTQKESKQTKQRKSNGERKPLRLLM